MQRTAFPAFAAGLALLVAGAGAASAQGIPDGVYASSKEGCTKLQSKSAKELGDDLDFYVLTKKGIVSGDQSCDFVNVTDHDAKSWVATSFCNEHGFTFPDLVSIAGKPDGSLDVTRLSDLSGTGNDETSDDQSGSDDEAADAQQNKGNEAGGSNDSSDDEGADDETMTNYVRCENAKQ